MGKYENIWLYQYHFHITLLSFTFSAPLACWTWPFCVTINLNFIAYKMVCEVVKCRRSFHHILQLSRLCAWGLNCYAFTIHINHNENNWVTGKHFIYVYIHILHVQNEIRSIWCRRAWWRKKVVSDSQVGINLEFLPDDFSLIDRLVLFVRIIYGTSTCKRYIYTNIVFYTNTWLVAR